MEYFSAMKDDKIMIVQTIRTSDLLESELKQAAEKTDPIMQEIMRLTMRIGLAHLEAVKYDLAKCVLDKSLKK